MVTNISQFFETCSIAAIIAAVIGYAAGSVSFAILVTKFYEKKDIREFGSGNAGMTNVLRSVGKTAGIITFAGDFLKCMLAALLSMWVFSLLGAQGYDYRYGGYIAGLFCVLGHMYPLFHGFKGGKGAVTAVSMIAIMDWRVFVIIAVIFFLTMAIFKTISISTIISASFLPVAQFITIYFFDFNSQKEYYSGNTFYLCFAVITTLIIGVWVIAKHHENIKRILSGTEKKFSVKK